MLDLWVEYKLNMWTLVAAAAAVALLAPVGEGKSFSVFICNCLKKIWGRKNWKFNSDNYYSGHKNSLHFSCHRFLEYLKKPMPFICRVANPTPVTVAVGKKNKTLNGNIRHELKCNLYCKLTAPFFPFYIYTVF